MTRPVSMIAFWLLVAPSACTGLHSQETTARDDQRCSVAVDFARTVIEAKGDRPLVFTAEDHDLAGSASTARWRMRNGSTEKPDAALLDRLQKQGGLSAVTRCDSLRDLLDDAHIAYGADVVQALIKASDGRRYAKSIETVSMPVLSADGMTAVLASSSVAGPMAGSGMLHMLKRGEDGQWYVIGSAPSWIS